MQTFKLLSNDSVLLSQPVLIKQFGRAGAHFLSQLHYWLTKDEFTASHHQGRKWIYNTAEEWAEQLQLSARHVRRLISEFVHLGIVKVEKLHKIKSNRTNYYSIDYERLNSSVDASINDTNKDKMSASLGQNVPMYIQKLPNKDFNKSEQMKNFAEVGEGSATDSRSQVKPVKDLNLKNQEKLPTIPVQTSQETEIVDKVDVYLSKTPLPIAKTSIAQDMLKIWNKCFADKAEAKLSKDLARLLVAGFKSKFNLDLKNWEEYCSQIHSSSYLMRDAFKLTITWALKFFTIERIRAGELGVKSVDRKGQEGIQSEPYHEQQIKIMIETIDESQSAKAVRHKIIQVIGHRAYFSWFHQAKFYEGEGGMQLIAPNPFVAQYWETHFDWVIKNNKN